MGGGEQGVMTIEFEWVWMVEEWLAVHDSLREY